MTKVSITQEIQRLDNIFKQISLVDEIEMQAHWAKYLCILVSGFLENSLRIMLSDYANKTSAPNIANYVNNHIKGITNLNNTKIAQLLGSFSDEWRQKYESFVDDEEKAAIDSVVNNRNSIAHGRYVGLTFGMIERYYKSIKKVVNKIYENCIANGEENLVS